MLETLGRNTGETQEKHSHAEAMCHQEEQRCYKDDTIQCISGEG